MLGKFRSIFSKEAIEVRADNVPSVLAELDEKSEKERLEMARSLIAAETRKLDQLLRELSIKQADDNYVTVLKNRFCEKGIQSLSGLPDSYDAFITAISRSMNEISSISFKEFRHLQLFKDDMAKIASQIKTIETQLAEFSRNYHAGSQKKINDALALSDSVQDKEAELVRLNTELQEIEKAIPFIKEALESDERKFSEVSNKLLSIESEVRDIAASLESERSIIKQRIGTEFGSIDKLLKKLQHENPKKSALLQDYITNPGNAFIVDENLEIRLVLEELKPALKKEDPEKHEKVVELLRNIDFYDSLREQYRGLTNKINDIRESKNQEYLPLEKEKNHIILSIEENKTEIQQLLEKRTAKTQEKEKLLHRLATEKAELQLKLAELMQREVRLV
ncbi:MAG: hypothetical protein HY514_04345 [Candidatus Aenigmarchaeota archaeon]|nr:hypothetical protein [Candidatus Aenigmarchaeota archaeon]